MIYRTLIVDDEEWVRRGLREQVDWVKLGIELVGEAQNGQKAKEFIDKYPVDIIITDIRMPIMDGIELMTYVNENNLDIIVIILSGFAEFEYAKEAIRLGAFSYLLKPIEEEDLEKVLKQAVNDLHNRRQKNHVHMEKRMTEFVYGQSSDEFNIEKIMPVSPGDERTKGYYCVVLKFYKGSVYKKTRLTIQHTMEWIFDIENEFSNSLVLFRNYVVENELVLIMRSDHTFIDERHRLMIQLDNFVLKQKEHYNNETYIGIGTIVTDIHNISVSYAKAVKASIDGILLIKKRIVLAEQLEGFTLTFEISKLLEKELVTYLRKGYKAEIYNIVNDLMDIIRFNQSYSAKSIRGGLAKLLRSIEETMDRDEVKGFESKKNHELIDLIKYDILSVAELNTLIIKYIDDIIMLMKSADAIDIKLIITNIQDSIENNYASDINLSYFSEQYHVSEAYLSKSFKKISGMNFSEALTRRRMDVAIKLLRNENITINDIADMVGYTNVNYFFKKFKNVFNSTPSEYRKKLLG